eukprot:CAMPEP_0183400340 /NCGR_PEP_ID=MMETSP0370-20130417/12528_1 /TAXON_ID=268820 /ORGANISM="Peridinium aciculiferum, Strain PAER-2" /LENGTH=541 /DNA_ID=CAMNT_0025581627 /DNA_START=62 /DNA_END=1687 /DNA_ORIENTATION=-
MSSGGASASSPRSSIAAQSDASASRKEKPGLNLASLRHNDQVAPAVPRHTPDSDGICTPRSGSGTPSALAAMGVRSGKLSAARGPRRSPAETPGGSWEGLAGWAPVAYKSTFVEPPSPGAKPPGALLEERVAVQHLSDRMVEQLNSMFASMTQVLARERTNHSSNITIMMRKVDKDLKDTYKTVKDIFSGLTLQLMDLVKEVESSRKQVRSIQEKYLQARQAAEAQAQYVLELEAVLDGQCAGISETMRKLNDKAVRKQQALSKSTEDNRDRELKLKRENEQLRSELRRVKAEENLLHGGLLPPLLPEMSATWTLRSPSGGSGGSGSGRGMLTAFQEEDEEAEDDGFQGHPGAPSLPAPASPCRASEGMDMVGAVLAHCDAGRMVEPVEACEDAVRHCSKQQRATALEPFQLAGAGPEKTKRKRVRGAEAACGARGAALREALWIGHICVLLPGPPQGCFRGDAVEPPSTGLGEQGSLGKSGDFASAAPDEVLDRLVHLFHKHIPTLTSLPEVLRALAREAEEGPPKATGLFEEASISSSR